MIDSAAVNRRGLQAIRHLLFSCGLVLLLLSTTQTSEGALRGHESFNDYDSGAELSDLAGGVGWTEPWFAEPIVTVEDATINFAGQSGAPHAAMLTGADVMHVMSRPFAPVEDTLYLGLLVRTEAWDDDFMQLQVSDGDTGNAATTMTIGLDGRNPSGFFTRIGTSAQGSSFSTEAVHEPEEDVFLIGKFSKDGGADTYNRVDLFVNPTGAQEPAVPDSTRDGIDSTLTQLSLFTVRTPLMEGDESIFLDEIRIATTFAEATLQAATLPDPGDFNADGAVNLADYNILKANFKEPGDFNSGDINYDGFVDLADFREFVTAFGAANPGVAMVPEPNGAVLFGLGAVLLARLRRRRESHLS